MDERIYSRLELLLLLIVLLFFLIIIVDVLIVGISKHP